MKRMRLRTAAAVLALVMGLSPTAGASVALGHNLHTATQTLVPGADWTKWLFWSDTYADLRAEQYVTYTPNDHLSPVVSYGGSVTARATLTAMAQSLEAQGERVIAGTNGDYYVVATGEPLGAVITGGVIRALPGRGDGWYYAAGFRADGTAVLGQPQFNVTATFNRGLTVTIQGGVNRIRNNTDGYFLFTEDFGPNTKNISPGVDVVLVPVSDELGQQVDVDLDITAQEPAQGEPAEEGELSSGELPDDPELPEEPREVTGTLTRSDRLIVNGLVRCEVREVLETDKATPIEPGTMILSVNKQCDPAVVQSLLDLQPGDRVEFSITAGDPVWAEVEEAMGAMYCLVKDGVVQGGLSSETTARTAIGVKADGSVVFYTIDGKQPGHSVGASFAQVAERLVELGCVEAVGLDGGGSTTMAAAYPDGSGLAVTNRPSEGRQRANSVAIFLTTDLRSTGVPGGLYLTPGDAMLLAGAQLQLSAAGVDTGYCPMGLSGPVEYTVISGGGRVESDGRFTAGSESGAVQVRAGQAGVTGDMWITVVKTPDTIRLTNAQTGAPVTALALSPGQQVDLNAAAEYRKLPLVAQDTCFTWAVDGAVGTVDAQGILTAGEKSATGTLTVSAGGKSFSVPVTVAGHVLTVDDFEGGAAALTGGTAAAVFGESDRNYVSRGTGSARIEYDLSAGAAVLAADYALAAGERYLGAWVYGDGSGNCLTADVADSAGEIHTVELARLDFTGWRRAAAELPSGAQALRGITVAPGEGGQSAGTLWLDQLTTANEDLEDGVPPAVTGEVEGTRLRFAVADNIDKSFRAEQVALTYDGVPLEFTWDAAAGLLWADLPEGDTLSHRVSVTAVDASGNIGRGSLDLSAAGEREAVFADTGSHWAREQILYLFDRGVIEGIQREDGLYFRPDEKITRGAFFLLAARWLGVDMQAYADVELPFDDLDATPEWMLPGIRTMYALGYLEGSTSGGKRLVKANATISRAEAVTILGRIQAKGYASAPLSFEDGDRVPDWARPYVETLAAQGVVSGSNNRFRPGDSITRAEAAKLFYTLI